MLEIIKWANLVLFGINILLQILLMGNPKEHAARVSALIGWICAFMSQLYVVTH